MNSLFDLTFIVTYHETAVTMKGTWSTRLSTSLSKMGTYSLAGVFSQRVRSSVDNMLEYKALFLKQSDYVQLSRCLVGYTLCASGEFHLAGGDLSNFNVPGYVNVM